MLTKDRVAGGALALFALWVVWESRMLPLGTLYRPGPAYMPVLLALLLLVFAVLIVAAGRRSQHLRSITWQEWPHAVAIVSTCIFCALALERLGYRLTVLLALLFLLKGLEKNSWLLTATFALVLSFGSFYLFYTLLRVPLPIGPWGN